MRRSSSILLLVTSVFASGAPAIAHPVDGQPVPQQDPVEPARPIGFERRDIEELDQRVEERRQRWRDEEAALARAKRARKRAAEAAPPRDGSGQR